MRHLVLVAVAIAVQALTLVSLAATEEPQHIVSVDGINRLSPCSAKADDSEHLVNIVYTVPVQGPMCPAGQATCRTFACGANGLYCCPASHPYLSHCDCQCYNASPDCQSYSACSR
jgi:hypothetical protein